MPPCLNHRKVRTGCKCCKARKVKCDEEKPRCSACRRLDKGCVYEFEDNTLTDRDLSQESHPHPGFRGESEPENALELRLMHEWSAYASESMSSIWEFWKHEAPVYAFQSRYVLDAILAIAALYASRQKPRSWSVDSARMVPSSDDKIPKHEQKGRGGWKSPTNQNGDQCSIPGYTNMEMLQVSRYYVAQALKGHREASANLDPDNMKAPFICSILVSFYSLFTLNEESGDDVFDLSASDAMKWIRLSFGTMSIVHHWRSLVGEAWRRQAGTMYGQPNLSDDQELYRSEHRAPFEYLLSPFHGNEIGAEDGEAYCRTLSYMGLIHKHITEHSESSAIISRRVHAFPNRVPKKFIQLFESQQPRAVVVMMHFFASLKLFESEWPWFRGIANRQVGFLCLFLPDIWIEMAEWPLQVIDTLSDHIAC